MALDLHNSAGSPASIWWDMGVINCVILQTTCNIYICMCVCVCVTISRKGTTLSTWITKVIVFFLKPQICRN